MKSKKTLEQKIIREILGYDKFLMMNLTLIQKLGLFEAVMLTYILDKMEREAANDPNVFERGIRVFRKEMLMKLGISEYHQRKGEETLVNQGILEIEYIKNPMESFNLYKVNIETILDRISS